MRKPKYWFRRIPAMPDYADYIDWTESRLTKDAFLSANAKFVHDIESWRDDWKWF